MLYVLVLQDMESGKTMGYNHTPCSTFDFNDCLHSTKGKKGKVVPVFN
jgi:hypothetical protein